MYWWFMAFVMQNTAGANIKEWHPLIYFISNLVENAESALIIKYITISQYVFLYLRI